MLMEYYVAPRQETGLDEKQDREISKIYMYIDRQTDRRITGFVIVA